jgi:hypothetical protein
MVEFRPGPRQCVQNGGLCMAVSEDARKSVVFFAKQVPPKPGSPPGVSSDIEYGGTGFVAAYADSDGSKSHYLITCRHVAEELDLDFFMRLNTVNGGPAELAPVENAEWEYHDDKTVDIAATPIRLNAVHYDHLALPLTKLVRKENLGCGQRIHIIGLFRPHLGQKRNVPIVHTGHIGALADPHEKVPIESKTGQVIQVESHLVEAQTLKGLSGSPVFIQEYFAWRVNAKTGSGEQVERKIASFGEVRLLGVYQGAWDAIPGKILAADRDLKGNQRVPLGMGLVVPIERVIELLEGNETLKDVRKRYKEAELSRRAAKMDSGFSAPVCSTELSL